MHQQLCSPLHNVLLHRTSYDPAAHRVTCTATGRGAPHSASDNSFPAPTRSPITQRLLTRSIVPVHGALGDVVDDVRHGRHLVLVDEVKVLVEQRLGDRDAALLL